ncbi:hypothetical protein [Pseudoalteromonas sp. T1lg23B]|uniref:hypothetical protein n=1 Tax=Pseudoalteromonas sp. T1lg23B TaxID=2077097 RepID=UPI000CF6225A|nr:hypothetical protein [Pseudoalteromonas sp. T1lg23B]
MKTKIAAFALAVLTHSVLAEQSSSPQYQMSLPVSGASNPVVKDEEVEKRQMIAAELFKQQNHDLKIDPSLYGIVQDGSAMTTEQKVLAKYRPRLSVKTEIGGNEMLPIAIGLPNRIKTNFKDVEVVGSFPETVYIAQEGGFVTISTNTANPIGLFLREYGMPETEVAVTLFPFQVGQAMINLDIKIPQALQTEIDRNHKRRVEEEKLAEAMLMLDAENRKAKPHIKKYSAILEHIAKGVDPNGFILQEITPRMPCPLLASKGINHVQYQQYNNARQLVDILVIENTSSYPVDFDESYCMYELDNYGQAVKKKDVIVVGSYPRSTLFPGEKAEVYILRNKELPIAQKSSRQRLIELN